MIYGTAIISGCMLVGHLIGEALGALLGVGLNVGGVGFAMLCLLLLTNRMKERGRLSAPIRDGISFWKGMYIPVVVAMAASQDVVSALSQGAVAIVAGLAAVGCVMLTVSALSKRGLLS